MTETACTRIGNAICFVALFATGLAMGAALAHLLELPNKIAMPREAYFATQMAYNGWAYLAWLLLIELVGMIGVLLFYRRQSRVLIPAVIAVVLLVAAQAIFWTLTFPANVATDMWTTVPDDWQAVRARWEYSHAAGALCQTGAFAALILAVLWRQRPANSPPSREASASSP